MQEKGGWQLPPVDGRTGAMVAVRKRERESRCCRLEINSANEGLKRTPSIIQGSSVCVLRLIRMSSFTRRPRIRSSEELESQPTVPLLLLRFFSHFFF